MSHLVSSPKEPETRRDSYLDGLIHYMTWIRLGFRSLAFWKWGYPYSLTLTSSEFGRRCIVWLVRREGGNEVGVWNRVANLCVREDMSVYYSGVLVEESSGGRTWIWKKALVSSVSTSRRSCDSVIRWRLTSRSPLNSIILPSWMNFMVSSV